MSSDAAARAELRAGQGGTAVLMLTGPLDVRRDGFSDPGNEGRTL